MGLELVHEYWVRPRTSTSMIQFDRLHARRDVGVGVSTRAETPLSTLQIHSPSPLYAPSPAHGLSIDDVCVVALVAPTARLLEAERNMSSGLTNAFVM